MWDSFIYLKLNSHNFKSLVFKGKSTIFDGFPVDKGRQNPHLHHYPQSAGGQNSIYFLLEKRVI